MKYFFIPCIQDIHVDNGGNAILAPGWIHPQRLISSSVLILGQKGTVKILVEDFPLIIQPGTVAILPAHHYHRGMEPLEKPASYLWMHFTVSSNIQIMKEKDFQEIIEQHSLRDLENGILLPFYFSLPEPEPFYELFHELLYEQECPSYICAKFQLLFQLFLIRLTEVFLSTHSIYQTMQTSSTVYEIIKIISTSLTDPNLSIKYVAHTMKLNPDYLGRRFKSVMKISMGDFILRKRIQLVKKQLEETRTPIAVIAQQCGFGSFRQFLRQFKHQTGMTPSQYRRIVQTMHMNVV